MKNSNIITFFACIIFTMIFAGICGFVPNQNPVRRQLAVLHSQHPEELANLIVKYYNQGYHVQHTTGIFGPSRYNEVMVVMEK